MSTGHCPARRRRKRPPADIRKRTKLFKNRNRVYLFFCRRCPSIHPSMLCRSIIAIKSIKSIGIGQFGFCAVAWGAHLSAQLIDKTDSKSRKSCLKKRKKRTKIAQVKIGFRIVPNGLGADKEEEEADGDCGHKRIHANGFGPTILKKRTRNAF